MDGIRKERNETGKAGMRKEMLGLERKSWDQKEKAWMRQEKLG